MPLAPLVIASIIGAGGAVAGGALANRGKQTSTTTPTYDPASQALRAKVYGMISDRLGQGPQDMRGYAGTGLADINETYNLAGQNLENTLTSRGLASSPVAGAGAARLQASRAGSIARFQNSIPLLQRGLQTEDLGLATSAFNTGRGVTSTGTAESGGGAAGSFTNLAGYLGYLIGSGAFAKQGSGTGPAAWAIPG